ncbi:MAG TPA: pantoate--beta-alanine ligase [Streptosporangiaceae bacterium]|nr:pantoate--beta-alanine ligase [Streptosporangiaceae bacterium]
MMPMIARTRLGLAAARAAVASPVVLVPTMGALHEGHRALLRRARDLSMPNGSVVVSIFVNPLQFGAGEDFERYPRTFHDDLAVTAQEGAQLIFAPSRAEMYPHQQLITVDAGPMGAVLEGASRPGHFAGVLTVVLKLFELTAPDIAVFGEKDAQQLALIRRMVDEFDLGIEIVGVPTVRDPDGLAISSRNRFLSAEQRRSALALSRSLRAGREAARAGPEAVVKAARDVLEPGGRGDLDPDYLELVDPRTFTPVSADHSGRAILVVAARVGTTRLIDNAALDLGGGREDDAADD